MTIFSVKTLIFFLLLLLSCLKTLGQQKSWYLDKPNVLSDSIAIIKNRVKTIECGILESNKLIKEFYNVSFDINGNEIDSVLGNKDCRCFIKKVKLNEIIVFDTLDTSTFKRKYILNKQGQIIKLISLQIKGTEIECMICFKHSKVLYEYDDNGLLISSKYYEIINSEEYLFAHLKYNYTFY